LYKFSEQIANIIEISHNNFKLFFAIIISFVFLVQVQRDIPDFLCVFFNHFGFLIESFNQFIGFGKYFFNDSFFGFLTIFGIVLGDLIIVDFGKYFLQLLCD